MDDYCNAPHSGSIPLAASKERLCLVDGGAQGFGPLR